MTSKTRDPNPLRRRVTGAVLCTAIVSFFSIVGGPVAAAGCPAGFHAVNLKALAQEVLGGENEAAELAGKAQPSSYDPDAVCMNDKHPEAYSEIMRMNEERLTKITAPLDQIRPGAHREALAQRQAVIATSSLVPDTSGKWVPYGTGLLLADNPDYGVSGEGLNDLSGRIDSLDYDPVNKRLFASIGTGGIWASDDLAKTWYSVGDSLPSQIIGAIAWTPAMGGTLVAVAGEPLMGGNTYSGLGAFYTRDLGKTWHESKGVPDEALGFQAAVDPTKPNVVYAATSRGLFRSADAGATFVNTRLPTGECAGKTDRQRCNLANFVTDVVVQSPDKFGNKGGTVLAAVGFRAGAALYPDGVTTMAPFNGLYRSDTGLPGSFAKLAADGFTPQDKIGRVEMGVAEGPDQNHDYVYAIVEDAKLFQGGVPVIDAVEDIPMPGGLNNTVLNGVYVSDDFGDTWTLMADETVISENPATGSALVVVQQALFYAPGAQAWYNMWIKPDPTRQTSSGVPTRLLFGLEEVWQNLLTDQAADGPTLFRVIGRYFAGTTCLFLDFGLPVCPTNNPPTMSTTTHPDQHDAIFVPDGDGGVTLIAGNDGGAYAQHASEGEELDNTKWGRGNNIGFNTLLPYDANMAKDGTVWFGLQDNGSGKVDPETGKYYMTLGGDGLFVAVDPDNSDIAYAETPLAAMQVTTDGGKTWNPFDAPITGAQFSNMFVMDPKDAKHLMTAGRQVVETVDGPDTVTCTQVPGVVTVTCSDTWQEVFVLGPAGVQMSALDLKGDAAYVGFCGVCDINGQVNPFRRGLATNVGGAQPPKRMTSDGWHVATAKGLPNRYITAVLIDPNDPKTVYVALGGYNNRSWVPPGSFGDRNKEIGKGHVFKSTNAGETFVDISGNLPDAPTFALALRKGQLIAGTNIGAFISSDTKGGPWGALSNGLPVVPIASLEIAPGDPDLLVSATFGRGIYVYRFPSGAPGPAGKPNVKGVKTKTPLPATGVGSQVLPALVLLAAAASGGWYLRRRSRI
jgi:LPXTG-motif cell wall-anchored protein